MMKSKKHILIVGFFLSILFVPACRDAIIPSETDLVDYGWVLYEDGDYVGANQWFKDGFEKDSSYMDAYNGLGWSFGKLGLADSAIIYFELGKELTWDDTKTPDLDMQFYAGLTFANNAVANDTLARSYGEQFFGAQNLVDQDPWAFAHNALTNHLDVRLTLASTYFSLSFLDLCITEVRQIHSDLGMTKTFEPDLNTVQGRDELVKELEILQVLLLTQ